MKAKYVFTIVFVISAVALLAMGIYRSPFFEMKSSLAGAFGITPPYIKHNAILPGDIFKRSITLVRSESNIDTLVKVMVKSNGFSDWMSIDEEIVFPAGRTRLPITIDFQVPETALAGEYEGSIYFVNSPERGEGVAIGLGARADIELTVLSEVDSMVGKAGSRPLRTVRLNDEESYQKFRGLIVLDKSDNYKVYYIHPVWHRSYFINDQESATELIDRVSLPIDQASFESIPISTKFLSGEDVDNDGLSNKLEDAIGTAKNEVDTDFDGVDDKKEIETGGNPLGPGAKEVDIKITLANAGRIVLHKGTAWYLDPVDLTLSFLGEKEETYTAIRQAARDISKEEAELLFGK